MSTDLVHMFMGLALVCVGAFADRIGGALSDAPRKPIPTVVRVIQITGGSVVFVWSLYSYMKGSGK